MVDGGAPTSGVAAAHVDAAAGRTPGNAWTPRLGETTVSRAAIRPSPPAVRRAKAAALGFCLRAAIADGRSAFLVASLHRRTHRRAQAAFIASKATVSARSRMFWGGEFQGTASRTHGGWRVTPKVCGV
jgi:hypothetical protein